jgi:hypothetical protein
VAPVDGEVEVVNALAPGEAGDPDEGDRVGVEQRLADARIRGSRRLGSVGQVGHDREYGEECDRDG